MRTAILRVTRYFGLRLLILAPAMFLFAAAGHAQITGNDGPTTVFQLNGDPAPANPLLSCNYSGGCDYWNLLNGNGIVTPTTEPGEPGSSLTRTFVSGSASNNVFTGGSKDIQNISQWRCTTGSTPGKDTLNAGYAAAYSDASGDYNFIFGADRYDPNGAANIGIWFFKASVTPACGTTGGFTGGGHTLGDIFLLAQFTTGGGTSVVAAYEWDPSCQKGVKAPVPDGSCAAANLRQLAAPGVGSECASTDTLCGQTNSGTVQSTWEGPLQMQVFFEGGMDVSEIFNSQSLPCFSTFMVETRSSPNVSAELKDFIISNFNVCSMSVSKQCDTPSVGEYGESINYPTSGKVTNTGVGTLYNVKVCDVIGSSTHTIDVADSLAHSGSHTWSYTGNSTSKKLADEAYAVASTDPNVTPSCSSPTAQGTVESSSPNPSRTCNFSASGTLSVSKSCSTSLVTDGDVHVSVAYSGMVCNNGPSEVDDVGLTEIDTSASPVNPTLSTTTLGPCEDVGADESTLSTTCAEQCTTTWEEPFDDSSAGSCTSAVIAPGACPEGYTCIPGNCATYTGSYTPTSDYPVPLPDQPGTGGEGQGRYTFSDTIEVTTATPAIGGVTLTTPSGCNGAYACHEATCPICGSGQCTQ